MSIDMDKWVRNTPSDSGVLIGSNLLALKIGEDCWGLSESFPLGWNKVFPSLDQSFYRYPLIGEFRKTLNELRYYSEKVIREFVLHNPEYSEKHSYIKDCFPYHIVSKSYSIVHYSHVDLPIMIEGRRLYSGQPMYWEIKKSSDMIQSLQGEVFPTLKKTILTIEMRMTND